ncbi:hypothetical protein M3B43_05035 [Nesterenkonia massiliensis]|uniref:Uncharacterized protein n=1 Tax=Nesterenkonia massiliensis TaxID=1232429 RepID=A0ABT2HPU5_9MICC|nr:hypothetical protein [Nesterenkonia massiliensis]MCT1606701.1 hypothetical protein [Nesterenkonia massiliensis]
MAPLPRDLTDLKLAVALVLGVVAGVALSFMVDSDDERLAGMGADLRRLVDSAVELVFILIRGVLQYSPIGVLP